MYQRLLLESVSTHKLKNYKFHGIFWDYYFNSIRDSQSWGVFNVVLEK